MRNLSPLVKGAFEHSVSQHWRNRKQALKLCPRSSLLLLSVASSFFQLLSYFWLPRQKLTSCCSPKSWVIYQRLLCQIICNGIHYIFFCLRPFIALSTCFCLSVSAILIPYSVHFLQCLQLVVAVRNIFLRTRSSKCSSSWHSTIPVSGLYSPITRTACKLSVASGSPFNRGSSILGRMDCVGFHYKTSLDNWRSRDLSILLVYCEEWCPDGQYTLGLSQGVSSVVDQIL